MTVEYLQNNITFALKNLFGEVGASTPFDVLKFEIASSTTIRIVLRCPAHLAAKVRASLTLQGTYQGFQCAYHVHKVVHSLLELTA